MRTNLILLILAAVLAVPTTLTILENRITFKDYQDVPALFDGFDPDNVVTIQVRQPRLDDKGQVITQDDGTLATDALVLNRPVGQENWVFAGNDLDMRGVRVRSDRVRDYVLQHMAAIRLDDNTLVAEDARPEDLQKYGLENGNPKLTQIFCLDKVGKPLAQILLGRNTIDDRKQEKGLVRGYFVRRPDRTDVLLYEAEFWQVSTDKQQWVDRNIFYRFPTDQAVEVSLSNKKGKVVFSKESADIVDWSMKEGPEDQGAVRQAEVSAIVASMQLLDAPKFLRPLGQGATIEDDLKALGFEEPIVELTVKLENGEVKSLRVGNKMPDENFFYMVTSTLPQYLLGVGDYQLHVFEAAPTKFFDPPADAAIKKPDEKEEGKGEDKPADQSKDEPGNQVELPGGVPPGSVPPGGVPPGGVPPGGVPPGSEPPGSEPPGSEPPGSEPPVGEPPTKKPPIKKAPIKKAPVNKLEKGER